MVITVKGGIVKRGSNFNVNGKNISNYNKSKAERRLLSQGKGRLAKITNNKIEELKINEGKISYTIGDQTTERPLNENVDTATYNENAQKVISDLNASAERSRQAQNRFSRDLTIIPQNPTSAQVISRLRQEELREQQRAETVARYKGAPVERTVTKERLEVERGVTYSSLTKTPLNIKPYTKTTKQREAIAPYMDLTSDEKEVFIKNINTLQEVRNLPNPTNTPFGRFVTASVYNRSNLIDQRKKLGVTSWIRTPVSKPSTTSNLLFIGSQGLGARPITFEQEQNTSETDRTTTALREDVWKKDLKQQLRGANIAIAESGKQAFSILTGTENKTIDYENKPSSDQLRRGLFTYGYTGASLIANVNPISRAGAEVIDIGLAVPDYARAILNPTPYNKAVGIVELIDVGVDFVPLPTPNVRVNTQAQTQAELNDYAKNLQFLSKEKYGLFPSEKITNPAFDTGSNINQQGSITTDLEKYNAFQGESGYNDYFKPVNTKESTSEKLNKVIYTQVVPFSPSGFNIGTDTDVNTNASSFGNVRVGSSADTSTSTSTAINYNTLINTNIAGQGTNINPVVNFGSQANTGTLADITTNNDVDSVTDLSVSSNVNTNVATDTNFNANVNFGLNQGVSSKRLLEKGRGKDENKIVYTPFAKVKGEFITVGKPTTSAKGAFLQGLAFTETTSARTFGFKQKSSSGFKGLDFSTPTAYKKKKVKGGYLFVEPSKRAINTMGELKGITFKSKNSRGWKL